jgi:hypothetical protein
VKLLVISFNDTASQLGMDESIPTLKQFMSFVRHRLIEGKPHEYKRLIHLLDAFIRNCGIRAQILIGRKKFLETIGDTARKYKGIPLPTCQECAAIAFDCIQAWSETFSRFKGVFPFYEEIYLKLKNNYKVQFPRPSNDKSRVPIPIDVQLLTEKFPARLYTDDGDTEDSSGSDFGGSPRKGKGNGIVNFSSVFDKSTSFYGEVSPK